MNVLWLTLDALLPLDEAGRIGVYKRLEKVCANHNVHLFYFYSNERDLKACEELKLICASVHGYKKEPSILKRLINYLGYPYTVSTRISKELRADVRECVDKNNIELVNVDFPQMGYYLADILCGRKIPVVINQHNVEWMRFYEISQSNSISKARSLISYLESKKLKKFEEKLYKRTEITAMTFVTENDLMYFREWCPHVQTELKVVPGGGELSLLENDKKGSHNVVFVGVMSNELNPEGAMWFIREVWPLIRRQINDAKFYVVGKDPTVELLQIDDESIVVTGYVEDLDIYYSLADVVVIPILHGGGVKLKLLEAIGHGKNVVATSKGAQGTEFVNGEHIFISDDPKQFAEICIDILQHPDKYEKMRKNAVNLFESYYTWNGIGARYCKFLEDIVNSKNA